MCVCVPFPSHYLVYNLMQKLLNLLFVLSVNLLLRIASLLGGQQTGLLLRAVFEDPQPWASSWVLPLLET